MANDTPKRRSQHEEQDRLDSRFELVTRRAFLQRSAVLGAAAIVPGLIAAACSSDGTSFTSTTAAGTSAASTTTTSETPAVHDGDGFPTGAELAVDFTYAASSSGGPVRNPYVAVWVEDAGGSLVATIALWFLRNQKGLRWLSDLRRWYAVDGSSDTIDTVSSATRTPGDYSVVWKGVSIDGTPVPQGDYYICIEAAREHGPYSLIRAPLTIAAVSFAQELAADGELSNATVEFTA